jgi:hypothetical protein
MRAPVRDPAPYSDPLQTGVLLGLLLFATILVAGRGLGASGAFAAGAAASVEAVAPEVVAGNRYLAERVPSSGAGVLGEWLVLELLGVGVGAWWSARRHGRIRLGVERVEGAGTRDRVARAALGGALMGAGARLAHGCTSGLALSGGAMLSTGAWVFMPLMFAAAFLMAWLLRRTASPSVA